ncbi:phosphotransferase family protein [Marisediminicola senii]|uniref:phosphotransferase family protein n=1 Tax=Marisediminicola senii TaxID=2711233 RepID=UPI0013EDCCC0|nr:phosphotransferase [Marisediminicola senii]
MTVWVGPAVSAGDMGRVGGAGRHTGAMDAAARTRAAERALERADPAQRALPVLFTAGALSRAVGRDVSVTRIRYKPGASVVVGFVSDGGDGSGSASGSGSVEHGWLAGYHDDAKVDKVLRDAEAVGAEARRIAPGIVVGTAAADRTIATPFARLRDAHPELVASARVIRHNPMRRLVFRGMDAGQQVAVKVTPRSHRPELCAVELLEFLGAWGVPVLPLRRMRGVRTAVASEWWGDGDLAGAAGAAGAASTVSAAAFAAGEALAALHVLGGVDDPLVQRVRTGDAARHARLRTSPARAAGAIGAIVPDLGDRAARLARVLRPRLEAARSRCQPTLLHGDFSPDQVLVGAGQTRLIDFDAVTWDAPERDLGSFAAVALMLGRPELTESLVDGYRAAGRSVDDAALRAWTAFGLLGRAVEPFREYEPQWVAGITRIVAAAEAEVAR